MFKTAMKGLLLFALVVTFVTSTLDEEITKADIANPTKGNSCNHMRTRGK